MNSADPKRFYLLSTTEGCATNLLENGSYRSQFESEGLRAASSAEDADIILINTCAYSQVAEDQSMNTITHFQKRFPGKEIRVAGCLPKINPKRVKENFKGPVVETQARNLDFSTLHSFNRIDFERVSWKHRLIFRLRPLFFKMERLLGFQLNPLHNIFKTVVVNEEFFLVTVSTGCIGSCTFCAIKRAKGSLRSRPLEVIASEMENGVREGFKSFWLLGDDIGCWGEDVSKGAPDLLKALFAKGDQVGIVLNYFDPHFLMKHEAELTELLSDRRIIGANIPVQSGSKKILERMKRDYDCDRVFSVLRTVKKRNPGFAIKTNIMIGFPGETWIDFFKSLRAIPYFDALLALRYSPRPNTPAEKFPDQVSERVKSIRLVIANTLIFFRHAWVAISSVWRLSRFA